MTTDTATSSNPFETQKSVYAPTDFVLWQQNDMLEITPKFQRRKVWRTPARSLLIDTMLRGMTIPPLYLRVTQNKKTTKIVREVVDGQQRVRSVLDFLDDGFRLSKTLNGPWAGKKFSQLAPTEQGKITAYKFSAEIFQGISDRQIFDVFCRLNMNGVQLNKQELRNGNYFGLFKEASYALALEYLEFWRRYGIFSEQSLARMLEVELTSELLIAGNEGMQDKKTSIDGYYQDHEETYPSEKRDKKRFRGVLAAISESFSGDEAELGAFRRPPLFYTLYCVVYHYMYGLPQIQRASSKKKLTDSQRESLADAVVKLSDVIAQSKDPATTADVPPKYAGFVAACARQTDNINPRKVRFNSLFGEAF